MGQAHSRLRTGAQCLQVGWGAHQQGAQSGSAGDPSDRKEAVHWVLIATRGLWLWEPQEDSEQKTDATSFVLFKDGPGGWVETRGRE